jgi:hypothetical protein
VPIRPGKHRRRITPGETYTGAELDAGDVELETVPPDDLELPEADQVGDLEHEGAPDDAGDDEPEQEVPF